MNDIHEANRACWNEWAEWWGERAEARGLWRRCHRDPSLVLSPAEIRFLSDVHDKQVCVLASGDNEVVFALAGMGAHVTSVDISEKQLEIARRRAVTLGLEITFLRADVTDLAAIPEAGFDLVYTGGHVSVWVSDLRRYYAEAARILHPGGLFLVNEYHPIRRMWLDGDGSAPTHRYFNHGPYEYRSRQGLPQIEFHWTTADHIQAVLDAGCSLSAVEEHGEGTEDAQWEAHTPASLPMYLLIAGRRRSVANRVMSPYWL